MNVIFKFPRFVIASIFFLSFVATNSYSQTDTLPPLIFECGTKTQTSTGISAPSSPLVGDGYSPYPNGAIVSCGSRIKLYYDDIAEGIINNEHAGFDDTAIIGGTTLGEIRRSTFCDVLNYVQHTFDFSNIDTAHPIRIRVMRSYNPAYYPTPDSTSFYARAFPSYDTTTNGIKDGWLAHYIKTGIDGDTNNYHGEIQINFDNVHVLFGGAYVHVAIPWHNSSSIPTECDKLSLYGTLLHELSHCLGLFSLVNYSGDLVTGFTPQPVVMLHNAFSKLDSAIFVGGNIFPLTTTGAGLTPLITYTSGIPSINTAVLSTPHNNNYWINALEAPYNHPVFSGGIFPYSTNSRQFISHLDDQRFSYTYRSRVSPGFREGYVMGPYSFTGNHIKTYTKGDLFCLHDVIGFNYDTAFASANPDMHVGNTAPYSKKMGSFNITTSNIAHFSETVPPDYSLTNNTGAYLNIDISSFVSATDISDPDGDTVRIDTASLINFRGCGNGGNNHNLLSWVTPGRVLRYTPRPDFYGKAQFGFYITDGIDRGSFVVITIEVGMGTNVGCAAGENMVCNPGFEEGTELANLYSPTIPNTTENKYMEGNWQGIRFSDSHPYNFHSNFGLLTSGFSLATGIVVRESWFACAGLYKTRVGNAWVTSSTTSSGTSIDNPVVLSTASGGDRYQRFQSQSSGLDGGGSYYYLLDSAKHCKRYFLEFDLYRTVTSGSFSSDLKLLVGFADAVTNLRSTAPPLNFSIYDTIPAFTAHDWSHITIPIRYCGTTPSNVLYIAHAGTTPAHFVIDNLSLKEDTTEIPPLTVTTAINPPASCTTQISTTVINEACFVNYSWSTADGTILSYNSDSSSITVPYGTQGTYIVTVYDGCMSASDTVIINAFPSPITGTPIVCPGATTSLFNVTPGGVWSSSDPSTAIVNISGTVTGILAGTVNISYAIISTGCYVTRGVTVNSAPAPITGSTSVCVGVNAVLSDITPGGSWGSSNMVVATVGVSSGIVTGVSPGTANITYQLLATGCYVTRVVTVNPPGANTSTGNACVGQVTTITNPTSGGVWSSSNTAIATISPTGDITGVTAGAVVITYAFPATGCYKTTNITVYSLPTIGGLSGGSSLSMCEGQSVTLLPLGGLWGSSNTTVATIGSLSGYVTGLSAGTTVITLTNATTGCYRAIVTTINPLPATITGTAVVCQGATTTLSSTTPGGIWSSSSTLATVGSSSGIVYGALSGPFGSGTVTITYTLPTTCRATAVVTVNYIPLYIGPTGGVALDYCEGQQHTMTSSPSGGTWSSSNTSIAAVIPGSGLVAGLSAGTAYISYTLPTGCYRYVQVTVHPTPAPITGTAIVCVGSTTTLSCSTPGGVWSSTGGLATVGSSSGIVTAGYIPSTTPIYYTVPFGDPYVCPASVTVTITATSAITGVASICLGAATALSSATPGGTWTSLAPSIATVDASGLVTSVAAGSATIVYTAAPCGPAYRIVTVNNIPATITGATSVCTGQTITLSSATVGGVWASGSPGVATVGITGIVTGISPGTAIINYSICGNTVTHVVSVNTQPAAITGITHVCNGLTTTLSDATAGGTWSSSTTSVGTIDASGVVTGLSTGTTTITYSMGSGCIATTIVSVIAAPGSFIGTIYNSVCPGHYVGLVSTTPGGTWSSSNPSVAYVGTGVSAGLVIGVSAGTATLTYSISTGCAITKTVAIYTDTTSACSPCVVHRYHMFNTLGLTSSSVSETPLTGGVYVPNDITISGNVTFNDAVVLIKPNVTIFVEHNSWLTSSGSHFLTCPDGVWEGIKLKTDTTLGETGKITLQGGTVHGSTLIEDAITGVEVHRPVAPNGGGLFIDSKNTIFNRNNTGISIKHYSPATPTSYEFNIENTIFTSRTFYLDFDSVYDDYPHSWPNTTGSFFGLKNIIAVPSVYHAPYNITNFVGTPCHNSIFPGYIGIELEDIGTNTSPAFSGINIGQPSTYSPLVSGSINAQMNLFDTLGFGIYATNANVRVINSTFMKMYTAIDKTNRPWPDHGNTGIYTTMDNGTKYKLTVEPGLYSYASWASAKTISPNRFFNCNYGVYSNDYFLIKGNGSDIRTTHNAVYGPRGYGYLLQSGKYQDVEVNNNKIYNVAKGIVFTSQLSGGMWISVGGGLGYWSVGSLEAGNVKVNYNRIQAAYIGAPTYEYCEDAITVQNIIDPTDPNTATGMVHADNDTIDNVYRGIHVSGYWQQKATSNGNIITVRKDLSILSKCWGICHANCMQDSVHENRVTAVSPTEADDSVSAYFMRLNNNAKVMCNYATGTGRGYEFYDINANAKWKHNHMNGNLAGLYLNYSRIDPQGTYYDPADNVWDGSTWSTATGHYQTFVTGPPASNESPLHVRYLATTLPIHNSGLPPGLRYTSSELPYSPGYPGWPTPECRAYVDDPSEIGMSAYTGVALHSVAFGSLATARSWVNQMVDWKAVNCDTTLTDTSVVLQSFATRANLSRFKYLTNIENELVEGGVSDATTHLGLTPSPISPSMKVDSVIGVEIDDDSTVDYLVNTYKVFYTLHLNYKTHSMTSSDSSRIINIAELCPLEYGAVVYQARALYTAVFQEVRTWNDTCVDFVDTTGQQQDEPGHKTGNGKGNTAKEDMQQYRLYPNPNDGNIVIVQMVEDTGKIITTVTDVAGRVVYRDNVAFIEGNYRLNLNKLSVGMYLMQLTDDRGRKYNFKFVKQW